MKRVSIAVIFGFFWASLLQGLSLKYSLGFGLFFLPPVMLVFSVYYFKPIETIFIALLCGFVADVLGGFPIGLNMGLMLVGYWILAYFRVLSTRISKFEIIYYIVAISFVYRLVVFFIVFLFLSKKANFSLLQFIFGPIADGFFSVLFYWFLVKMLLWVKSFEQHEIYRNRVGLGS